MREFFEILDTAPAVHDRPHAKDVERFAGAVAFENVSFSYDGKRPAVQDVSFTVRPGENVALVGATGSGKSTTLGLLHRAFDPQSGADPHRRRRHPRPDARLAPAQHRRRVPGADAVRALDPREPPGRPARRHRRRDDRGARARPGASSSSPARRTGLDTIIGERGRSLSGGERQRLSIARALLKNPPILILDEATSALDAATERKLQKALDEVMKGRTTFVIAHRLATIRNADRILVFDQGRVIETGTFDELVAKGGRFAELARAQFMAGDDKARVKRPRVQVHEVERVAAAGS